MSDKFAKRAFQASALFLLALAMFVYGMIVIEFRVWPYHLVQEIYGMYQSLVEHGEVAPENLYVKAPADAPRAAFTRHRPEQQREGHYAFLGYDQDNGVYAAWLYDHAGQLLHRWEIDYEALDPDGPLNGSDDPHGFAVLRDGSILVNFDHGDVMGRLDPCSRPLWARSGIFHHSLKAADDGSYWTWRGEGTSNAQYHYLVNFDPQTGETIREIGLIEDIIRHMGPQAVIFGVRPDEEFQHFEKTPKHRAKTDYFHPNDVDVLSARLAPGFPQFEAGDLLLSFRTIHLIAVLDPDSRELKWWSHGPWRFQHDPDFTPDGRISVYSNNDHGTRSEIIKMDTVTREIENPLFGGELSFYSRYMGKHQYLPGGNLLVVVPEEGRVLEVTARGDKVMEFNNMSGYNTKENVRVQNGRWLPPDYFETLPDCP